MTDRKGWTVRLGLLGVYRITRPSTRVRFGHDRRSVSFGWLIVSRL